MFSQLFFRSDALARQLSAPLVYERGQYLNHCAAQGMSGQDLWSDGTGALLRVVNWPPFSEASYPRLNPSNASPASVALPRLSRFPRPPTPSNIVPCGLAAPPLLSSSDPAAASSLTGASNRVLRGVRHSRLMQGGDNRLGGSVYHCQESPSGRFRCTPPSFPMFDGIEREAKGVGET